MTSPATGQPQTGRSARPYLSNSTIVPLCMFVTVVEGCNLIVFGAVVPSRIQTLESTNRPPAQWAASSISVH
ncbi:hypothetical protein SAMN04487917_103115 [Arthrobacter sp. yr096]|uniref:hypothetical protein n=1 Tax=unclassified Arthrobacter TaxID=235627 RepID=UPI00089CDAA3|nr:MULTISPECIES: hypothetical protein [unclassified Arthrobacter]SDW88884.1 hypothetical protein SAMN04487912_105245 [Arthrobacter sp. cf158]SEI95568.1 hypothetical protein SAMN04487917_103115 [Arthrobacter sp. yr096]